MTITNCRRTVCCCLVIAGIGCAAAVTPAAKKVKQYDPTAAALADIAKLKVGKHDWPQWGGWSGRNNTPPGENIAQEWDVDTGKNIKWSAKLGSQTYGKQDFRTG